MMIYVNGQRRDVVGGGCLAVEVSYLDVVKWARDGKEPRPDVLYTVTYFHRATRVEGSLLPGQSVEIADGMIFDAMVTGGA